MKVIIFNSYMKIYYNPLITFKKLLIYILIIFTIHTVYKSYNFVAELKKAIENIIRLVQ